MDYQSLSFTAHGICRVTKITDALQNGKPTGECWVTFSFEGGAFMNRIPSGTLNASQIRPSDLVELDMFLEYCDCGRVYKEQYIPAPGFKVSQILSIKRHQMVQAAAPMQQALKK